MSPGSDLDAGLLLPRFEVGARDRRIGIDPVDALELGDVVEHGAGGDAAPPVHDAALDAAALGGDVLLDRDAVVHLPVLEEVAPGVDVRDGLAVIAHLVVVGRAGIGDGVGHAVEDAGREDVGGGDLRLGVGERHHDAVLHELVGVEHLLGRDEARRALGLLADRRPAAPGLELGAPLLVLGAQRRGVRRCGRRGRLRGRRGLGVDWHVCADEAGGRQSRTHCDRCQTISHAFPPTPFKAVDNAVRRASPVRPCDGEDSMFDIVGWAKARCFAPCPRRTWTSPSCGQRLEEPSLRRPSRAFALLG